MKLLKNKPLLIALIAVILLSILALVTSGERTVSWFESAVGAVAQPVQTFASKASSDIIDFFQNLFNTTDADKENQQLKVYIAQLEQDLAKQEQIQKENERLKTLLSFTETMSTESYITATAIGKSQGIWFDVFTINAGRNQGVSKNMPVVNGSGLVGRVTDVGATWSKVMAVLDAEFSVSVMVERTRDNGMLRGLLTSGGDINNLELYYLPSGSDLLPGDKIVTSGLGELFPKGILVGTVSEVSRVSDSSERNAIVEPAVDFSRIEEVMVVTTAANQNEGE